MEQKSGIDYNWEKKAACRELTQEQKGDFYPVSGNGKGKVMIKRARKICMECPVLYECLHSALTTNERYGVWGMSSPKQRLRFRRSNDDDGNLLYLDIANISCLYEQMIGDMTVIKGGDMIEL